MNEGYSLSKNNHQPIISKEKFKVVRIKNVAKTGDGL